MGDCLFFLDSSCLECVRHVPRASPLSPSTAPAWLERAQGSLHAGYSAQAPLCAWRPSPALSSSGFAGGSFLRAFGPCPRSWPRPALPPPPVGAPCASGRALSLGRCAALRCAGRLAGLRPVSLESPPPIPCPPLGGGPLVGPACGRLRGTARRRRCPGAAARRPAAQRPGRCRLPRRRICPQGAPAPQPRPKARREGARVPPRPSARTGRLS